MALDVGAIKARLTLNDIQYQQALNRTRTSTQATMASVRKLMTGTLVGLATFRLLKDIVKRTMDFEGALHNVASIALELNIDKIREEMLKLDPVLGRVTDLTDAFYHAYSSGMRGTEAELANFTGQISILARTIRSEQDITMKASAIIMNAYGLAVKDATKVTSILYQTVRLGLTTGPELASTIGMVANSAALAGIELDELSASIATLSRTLPTARAITALNRAILSFLKPTQDSVDAAAEFGIELSATALKSKGFFKAMEEVNDVIGDMPEAIAKIFPRMRAFRAVASLAGTQAETFANLLGQIRSEGDVQLKGFARQIKSFSVTWEVAMTSMDTGLIKVGQRLKESVSWLAEFIKVLGDVIGETKNWQVVVVASLISFALLKTMIIPLIALISKATLLVNAHTASLVANTVATKANATANVGLSGALGMSTAARVASIHSTGMLTGGIGGLSSALTSLALVAAAAFIGWKMGRVISGLVDMDEKMQNFLQTAGLLPDILNKINEGLAFITGENFVDPRDIESKDAQILTAQLKSIKNLATKVKEAKPELAKEVQGLYDAYLSAMKKGNASAAKTAQEEIKKLYRAMSNEAEKQNKKIEADEKFKLDMSKLVETEGVGTEVAKRLMDATREQVRAWQIESLKLFKTAKLELLTSEQLGITIERADVTAELKEIKRRSEQKKQLLDDDLQNTLARNALGWTTEIDGHKDVLRKLKDQRDFHENEIKGILTAIRDSELQDMHDVTKELRKELKERVQAHAEAEEAIVRKKKQILEASPEFKLRKAVKKAGGLKGIRDIIFAAEAGTARGLEESTIQKFRATLNKEQRSKLQDMTQKLITAGTPEVRAKSIATATLKAQLDAEAKRSGSDRREMIKLLRSLDDYFKLGKKLVLDTGGL